MTDQNRDTIKYKGQDYCHINFIFPYKNEKDKYKNIKFPYDSLVAPHTALGRGFHVNSEVIDEKLVITEFRAFIQGKEGSRIRIEISDVIKNAKLPLFAYWFSGKIRCFLGNNLISCEELLILHFDKGFLIETSSLNRRKYFRSITIGHILDEELNNVKLTFEHTKGCFREIRKWEEIFWIESFNDDNSFFQTYDEISRDAESVTMKMCPPDNSGEYLVKTLLDEGKMQCSRDDGKSWNNLYEIKVIKIS